jgi:predicted nucleic acid-binding protein
MPRVLDASAAVTLLINTQMRSRVQGVLRDDVALAPAHIDAEVLSALRGLAAGGRLDAGHAGRAVALWARAPVRRWPTVGLLAMAWDLRETMSAYDALYVALARAVRAPLVTADRRLARTAAPVTDVVLV